MLQKTFNLYFFCRMAAARTRSTRTRRRAGRSPRSKRPVFRWAFSITRLYLTLNAQDDLIVDSGFEISTKDSPETRPTSSPARKFNYSRADIEVSTVLKAADKEPEKSDEQQAIWHQRLLSGLVLLVVLGACGFGLLLTLRQVVETFSG
jgi:hypothetical protein